MRSRNTIAVLALSLALSVAVVVPTAAAGPITAASTPSASLASPVTTAASVTTASSNTGDFVSDLADGVGLPPSKGTSGVEQVKSQQDSRASLGLFSTNTLSSAALLAGAVPLEGYLTSGIVPRAVPIGERPYANAALVRGLVDITGVRMFRLAGDPTMYDHPVGQAQLSMAYLDQYRLTRLPAYLRLAKVNAQRLVDRRVESRGGWYYPYDFDFAVHGDTTETLTAPWYSGMAQGLALSAFTRLFQATGDPAWKTAADATYASLDNTPVEGEPFGSWVSSVEVLISPNVNLEVATRIGVIRKVSACAWLGAEKL